MFGVMKIKMAGNRLPGRIGRIPALCVLSACLLINVSGQVITNVQPVNVTASGFSVVWRASGETQSELVVFADPAGSTNILGTVGLKAYPLRTGDPAATNEYSRRLSQRRISQRSRDYGLEMVRVSGCLPDTTYYYKILMKDDGQLIAQFPESGALPSVTTARENEFATTSKQLLLNVAGGDVLGYFVLLTSTNSAYPLAAVVGDGVDEDQVYFNLNEFLDISAETNYLPSGDQVFTAQLFGPDVEEETQDLTIGISSGMLISQAAARDFSGAVMDYLALSLGFTNVLAGESESVPMDLLVRGGGVTNIAFNLNLANERLTNFTVVPEITEIIDADIESAEPNGYRIVLRMDGRKLVGDYRIARLSFDSTEDGPSLFAPLQVAALEGLNNKGVTITNVDGYDGEVVVIGERPILDIVRGDESSAELVLYAKPSRSYAIEATGVLSNSNSWPIFTYFPMTNTYANVPVDEPDNKVAFYRAREFAPAQPVLDIVLRADGSHYLLLYGVPGESYRIEYAVNINFPIDWQTATEVTLTNSFEILEGITNENIKFYRARMD